MIENTLLLWLFRRVLTHEAYITIRPALSDFFRTKMREESFARKVFKPLPWDQVQCK